jgi:hypothetical protein
VYSNGVKASCAAVSFGQELKVSEKSEVYYGVINKNNLSTYGEKHAISSVI